MVAEFVKDLAKISGEAEGVGRAFAKIGSVADLQNLRNNVRGTISDFKLMQEAVKASTFGVPVKELGTLLQFAGKMANDTGQDMDYLVESIVIGIGRKSPKILDNLGISADKLKSKMKGVSMESATVSEVTTAVASIARDYMTEFGGMAETNATKIQRITAEWENFKKSLATSDSFSSVLSGLLTDIEMIVTGYAGAGDIAKGIFSDKYWENLTKRFAAFKYNKDQAEKYSGMYGEGESEIAKEVKAVKSLTDTQKEQKTAYETLTAKITELEKKRQDLALANKDVSDITAQINALKNQKTAVDDLLKSLDPKTAREFREEMQKAFDLSVETRGQMAPTFSDRYERPIIAGESQKEKAKYEPIDTTQLADMTGKIEANLLKIENAERSLQATTIDIGREIEGVFQNMAVGIGESLGNMIAGIEGYDNAGNMVIGVLADLAVQVGQIAVGVGVATLGIKKALESLNPAVAIAAGVALIALGTAAKGALSKAAGGGGGSYNSGVYDTRSISSQKQMAGLQANAMRVEIVGETSIKNRDIYIAYKNAESNRKIKT
jgi:hypothetical protein